MLAFGQPSRYQRTGTRRSCHDTCPSCAMADVRNLPRSDVRMVSCPASRWTSRSDRLPDTACPVVSGRTRSPPTGTPPPKEGTRTGDGPSAAASDVLDRHNYEHRPPAAGPQVGPPLAAGLPMTAQRRRSCPSPSCPSPSRSRLGALLSSDDYGSRVERLGACHPLGR
jgi:hypothetical protein